MKKWIAAIVIVAVLVILAVTGRRLYTYTYEGDEIRKGVYIAHIDVGGMSKEQAEEEVKAYIESLRAARITLTGVEGGSKEYTAKDLGMFWANKDVAEDAYAHTRSGTILERYGSRKALEESPQIFDIEIAFDKETVHRVVKEQNGLYNREAVEPQVDRINGEFVIEGGVTGYRLSEDASVEEIYRFLTEQWQGEDAQIPLVIEETAPKATKEELMAMKDLLGSFTTAFRSSTSARVANVDNGARLIDGSLIYPGEEFSSNDRFLPFTAENGYHMAGSYLNGMLIDSLGGGVCQVSTTLYNAVIRAELDITERHNHSLTVSYVPIAADAAVSDSAALNFKFVNTTEYPIYLEAYTMPDKTITVNIYGVETRPEGRQVSFESEITEVVHSTTQDIIQTQAQPVGYADLEEAKVGYKARLWKIVTENGVQTERTQVNSSNYKMVPRTVTVGVSTDNPEEYNQIQAAIATGNLDHVKAVADAIAAQKAAAAAGLPVDPTLPAPPPVTEPTPPSPDAGGSTPPTEADPGAGVVEGAGA
ncbi:MAG: VanW family protein [Lachnospiraceae bacterium]|nr:VanW family protein [Lachnospiraceae bacterium]